MPTSGFLVQLRQATRDLHAALEREPVFGNLLAADMTCVDYALALDVLYRIYGAIEPGLRAGLGRWLPEHDYVARLPLLAADLRALSYAVPDRDEQCSSSCAVAGRWQTLGMLYVVEGSLLGGRVITRHLRTRLGAQVAPALSFYGLGERVSAQTWPRTVQLLERQVGSAEDYALLLAAARQTFACFLCAARAAPVAA